MGKGIFCTSIVFPFLNIKWLGRFVELDHVLNVAGCTLLLDDEMLWNLPQDSTTKLNMVYTLCFPFNPNSNRSHKMMPQTTPHNWKKLSSRFVTLRTTNKHLPIEKKWAWKKKYSKYFATYDIIFLKASLLLRHGTLFCAQGTDKSQKLPRARAIVAMPTSSVELLRYAIFMLIQWKTFLWQGWQVWRD